MKFRKGDKVSMIGTVKYDSDDTDGDDGRLFVTVGHEDLWLKPYELTLVTPVFDVGETVGWSLQMGDGRQYGTILAMANDHAWIDLGNGDYCTRLLTTIERTDASGDDIPV